MPKTNFNLYMKKLILLLLFILPLGAFSQSKKSIDGFLDIPFGSDSATVKSVLTSKGATRVNALCTKDELVYFDFEFSGRKVFACAVKFVDDRAYEADLIFSDFAEKQLLDYYDNFAADITAVYGKGTLTNNFGNMDNPQRIRGIKSGSASCQTLWRSKNGNAVQLKMIYSKPNLQIALQYQDSALWSLVAAKRRSDL
jgi:hypothetical protein